MKLKKIISSICVASTLIFSGLQLPVQAQSEAPDIDWEKSLGGSGYDHAESVVQTADGGYIVAGKSNSVDGDVSGNHGKDDYWVVKLDEQGNMDWEKSLGGSSYDHAESVVQTADGGYIVAGYSYSNNGDVSGNHGDYDYWVVKLDEQGNMDWEKSLGGSDSDVAQSVIQTTDGGYIVAGRSSSIDGDVSGNHGSVDYWVVKLDEQGNIEWEKSLGGSVEDGARSVVQTADGGYIVAGFSGSNNGDVSGNHGSVDFSVDYWVVKLDEQGNIEWEKCLGGSSIDDAESVVQTADGGYIVAGYSYSNNGDVSGNHGDYDYWVVKLKGESIKQLIEIEITSEPTKTEYFEGENLDLTGLEVIGKYNDGSQATLEINMDNISGFNSSSPAKDLVVTVTVDGQTASFTVDIVDMTKTIFSDIKKHWAESYIATLFDKSLINGYEDGTFKPNGLISREEAAQIFSNYVGISESEDVQMPRDSIGRWSSPAIQNLIGQGIIEGYEDGTFRPKNKITRAEFTTMAHRVLTMKEKLDSSTKDIPDVSGHWAETAVESLAGNGVITGYKDGTFRPGNNITRAEVATIIALADEE